MSGGLFSLLDDVAALAKLAAASVDDVGAATGRATTKAAGVVVDDTAVTPQYVHGVAAQRELPIVKRIAVGSVRNKLLVILPVAMLLSQFVPDLLTPILMIGGAYLSYEGAEKIWGRLRGHDHHDAVVAGTSTDAEKELVAGAIRTDLILSAEIMVIALNEVADESFWTRLVILVVVGVAITIAVYGVVGLIVKMDDIGLHLAGRRSRLSRRVGRSLVTAMPALLQVISVVGIAAMLWVGGHILLNGLHDLGWHWPADRLHDLDERLRDGVPALGGVLGWLADTLVSALVGVLVGAVLVAAMMALTSRRERPSGQTSHEPRG